MKGIDAAAFAWLTPLACAVQEHRATLYAVGGSVRNAYIGYPLGDTDIASCMDVAALEKIAGPLGYCVFPRNTALGTADILKGENRAEYTRFRTESYTSGHTPDAVLFTDDLRQDALRRDFTVNALYLNLLTGEVEDPLGGLGDLDARVLRACRTSPLDTLKDDGLRILRMVRFAGELGFSIQEGLYQAAKQHIANLAEISPERKREELNRILLCDAAYPENPREDAVFFALKTLHGLGAFAFLLPELLWGEGFAQNSAWHRYDVLNHNFHTCSAAPAELSLRLAGLLHDVAKPKQMQEQGNMHHHAEVGADIAEGMLLRLRYSRRLTQTVCQLIRRHMFDLDGRAKEKTCRVRFANWGFGFVETLILLRKADIIGSGTPDVTYTDEKWQRILEDMIAGGAIDDISQLAIDGRTIQSCCGISEGKEVGRIKQLLFDQVARNPALNTREALMRQAQLYHRSLFVPHQ